MVLVPVTTFRVQLSWYRWAVLTWLAYYLVMALAVLPLPRAPRSNFIIWLVLAATLALVCAYRLELLVRMFWFTSTNGGSYGHDREAQK